MASGLVYAMTDIEGAEVDITFKGGALDGLEAVRRKQEHAEQLMAEASEEMRKIVSEMDRDGLKQSEIAAVLKISRQRAAQLVKSATARPDTVRGKAKVATGTPRRTRVKAWPRRCRARCVCAAGADGREHRHRPAHLAVLTASQEMLPSPLEDAVRSS